MTKVDKEIEHKSQRASYIQTILEAIEENDNPGTLLSKEYTDIYWKQYRTSIFIK